MPLPSGPRLGLPSQSGLGPKGKKSKKKHTSRSTKPTKPVLRDLVLIPNPEETTVPTHSTRVLLDSKGFVVHSFPFQREWDSRTLTSKIDEAFPMYTLLCFEYMKASYGKLIKPNLASGVQITGNLLLKLSGQGSVYIRSLESLDGGSTDDAMAQSPVSDSQDFPEYIPPCDELFLFSDNSSREHPHTAVTSEAVTSEAVSYQNPLLGNHQTIIPAVDRTVNVDDPILIPDDVPLPNLVPSSVHANEVYENQPSGNQSKLIVCLMLFTTQ